MSLQAGLSRTFPPDIYRVGQQVLAEENLFRQIGDRFDELFPEESEFTDIYQPTGRGAISPVLLSIVTAFQIMEKLPDRVAAEYVASRIDWKYALHLPLAYPGFHFTDLSAFRQRLLAHGWEQKVFEQLLEKLRQLGFLRSRGKMRTDSTHLLGLVEWLSRLELVLESIRLALRAVRQAAPDWANQHLPRSFCEVYAERASLYGLSDEAMARGWTRAGQDGVWFLAQIDRTAPASCQHLAQVEVLRQVLAQQFPEGPDQPLGDPRPSGKSVIQTPHDAQARQGVKRAKVWLGYKVQVTETCDEDFPHLVVDIQPGNALEQDNQALPAIQARLAQRGILPAEQFADQAYISVELIAQSLLQEIRLWGPCPPDTHSPPGLRQSDFQIDRTQRRATCPTGQVSRTWSEKPAPEGQRATVQARFSGKVCQACAFFGKCTRSPQGRTVEVHPYHELLELYRRIEPTDAFRRLMRVRSGIEGTLSELTRKYGLRRARYRGEPKIRLQAAFTAVAINLNRIARWWSRTAMAN